MEYTKTLYELARWGLMGSTVFTLVLVFNDHTRAVGATLLVGNLIALAILAYASIYYSAGQSQRARRHSRFYEEIDASKKNCSKLQAFLDQHELS